MAETTLGQRIAERRKMLGLSQEALGEKLGLSRQDIEDVMYNNAHRLIEDARKAIYG